MRWTLSLILSLSMCSAQLFAEQHIVSPADIQQRIHAAAGTRGQQLAGLDRLLSKDGVRKALQTAKIDASQVRSAAALLSDDELASLSARAGKIDRDIAAGALNNQELTYIVIALATAVLILIIVKA